MKRVDGTGLSKSRFKKLLRAGRCGLQPRRACTDSSGLDASMYITVVASRGLNQTVTVADATQRFQETKYESISVFLIVFERFT